MDLVFLITWREQTLGFSFIHSAGSLTCDANRDELRSKCAVWRQSAWVWMQVLEMTSKNAFLSSEQESFASSKMLHFARTRVTINQVRENPADFSQTQNGCHLLHFSILWIFQQLDSIFCAFLRRLINRNDASSDAQRNVSADFVSTIEESDSLISTDAPVVQELVNDAVVLKQDVVNVSIGLRIQSNCRRLTLWANAFGPWWMLSAASFDSAIDVFERHKLATIYARCLFTEIRMEREMLDLLLWEISCIVRFKRWAMNATAIVRVTTQLLVFLAVNPSV